MQQIEQYFSQNVDSTLYHYTGVGSLMGMANTKCLWASNIYYMNDSKEIVHACNVLENVLRARLAFGNPESSETEFLKQFQNWVNFCRTTTYDLFVFSLSEESSILSQWRSYTPHGKGVSIGFPKDLLDSVMQKSNLRIAKCIYKTHEQEQILSSLIEKLLRTFRQDESTINLTQAHPTQSYHPYLEKFRSEVLQVLAIIKHKAFEEEKEWRLISAYYPMYTIPAIKFREGASMLVPYIEIPLGESKPYFEKVILGPSPHQNLSMSALAKFLSNQNLCGRTENSVIPYREW
jgi:hypothetical protein